MPGSAAVRPIAIATPLLVLMTYTIPMTTLTPTATELGANISGQIWMLNGTPLGLAATLLVSGRLADDFGQKRALVAGSFTLAAAGALVAASSDARVFVLARVVQGAASAAMLASSLGIIGRSYAQGRQRTRATSQWGATLSLGIALGPLLAGIVPGWRAAYWILAAGGLVLGLAALLGLSESRTPGSRPIDVPGVLTLGAGLTALLAGVTEGRLGWGRPSVILLLVAATALLGGFVVVESRRRSPMIEPSLFRQRAFVAATAGAFTTGIAVIGVMSCLPTLIRTTSDFGPLASGLLYVVWSGTAFVVAPHGRRLPWHARHQLATGFVLSAIGTLALWCFADSWSWQHALAGLVISGIGSGLANAALAGLAIESVPTRLAAMGSGANSTARYVGSAIGVAMVMTLATNGGRQGANTALAVSAGLAIAGGLIVLLLRKHAAPRETTRGDRTGV